jgi:hypothetical protein
MSPLLIQTYIDKTLEKMRSGGLPPVTDDQASIGCAYGFPCSGCGESIEGLDEQYLVKIRGGARLRFHAVCYNAWSTFQRSAA